VSRPIRLAYVIKSMGVGGSQTHLTQVLRFLDRSRFDPVLYCLSGEGALLDTVRSLGVPVMAPAARLGFKGPALLLRIAALARAFHQQRADIVHNYLLRANLVGSLGARLARVPVVLCSKRGCHERRGFALVSAKIGNRLAHCVSVNARAVREFVHANEGCAREKMIVIPSGIDTTRFRPLPGADCKAQFGLPANKPIVGAVTRMRVVKGVEEFIRGMRLLRDTRPDVHAVMVGEVTLDEKLQSLVRSLRLEDHLTLLGPCRNMPEVYSTFDVFVLSSHGEGMSNALLEAMAMEKPVVATDVGGTGEVVRHRQSGLLVPAKEPAALASAINEVLSHRARALEMGRTGRRIVEEVFSAQAMVRRMEHLYFELAVRRGLGWAQGLRTAA
jgi:glycosyltransferase involved in cell wall biosynthesis